MTGGPAIFLDRDGVINLAVIRDGKPYPPGNASEVRVNADALVALPLLKQLGFRLYVVTNQPDVSRRTQTREQVEAIHARLSAQLPIDGFFTCYHDDRDQCGCRKPLPGLILDAIKQHAVRLSGSFLIGDRWRDISAGQAAGLCTVFIDYEYSERRPFPAADRTVSSLSEAADWIRTVSLGSKFLPTVDQLTIKIFADGADKKAMLEMFANPLIQGFTTNPTLMRKAGITDYEAFSKDILSEITGRPISLEVFADDFLEMERQALKITKWGPNVYVKIPVTNTKAEPALQLIHKLSHEGVKLNVTALLTLEQVRDVTSALSGGAPSCVSVFAGRVADTGRDPVPMMAAAASMISINPGMELIWASPRELLNVFQADSIGCHIITATTDILKKLRLVGKNLQSYSLETVQMFHQDAAASQFQL